jgi:hypothetical protein
MARYTSSCLKLMSCLILLVCASAIGCPQNQQSRENQDWEQKQRDKRREERETENRIRDLRNLDNLKGVRSARRDRGPGFVNPSKLTDDQKKLLQPSPNDVASFARFLGRPKTGILRLLPREKYDYTNLMPIRGGGAFYSFTRLSHEANPWSDIKFQDDQLHTGFNDQGLGLMAVIGNAALEDVGLDNPAVRLLSQLALPALYAEHKTQAYRNKSGFKAGGSVYQSTLPAQLDVTYVLRSTIYNGMDSVIAFRIIRRDSDGGITLLWKMLSQLPVKKPKDMPREYRDPFLL